MKKGDKYSRIALRQGYRSRAALKLKSINERFNFVKEGDDVLDLGCTPGGCLQVLKEISKTGYVLGVDVREMKEIEGTEFINKDFNEVKFEREFDVVFSDMGPLTPGLNDVDMDKALEIENNAVKEMKRILKKNGNFVMKIFQDERLELLLEELFKSFKEFYLFKPEVSRKGNKEVYVVCLGKK